MESKIIKRLLAAILAALIVLIVSLWGMFLWDMNGESAGVKPIEPISETTGPASSIEVPTHGTNTGSTEKPAEKFPIGEAVALSEPNEEGWMEISLPFFKEPVLAKTMVKKGDNIFSITVKVSEGMEIMTPAECWFGRGGNNGNNSYIFSPTEGYYRDTLRAVELEFDGGRINYSSESGTSTIGNVIGTFSSDGEAIIRSLNIEPAEIGQNEIIPWFNEMMRIVFTGE